MNTVSKIRNGRPIRIHYRYNYCIEFADGTMDSGCRTVLSDKMEDVKADVLEFIRATAEELNNRDYEAPGIVDVRVYGLCRVEHPEFDQQDFHENVIMPALKDALPALKDA